MSISSFFRSSSQTKKTSASDGVLSMPSARAVLISSVGCMLVLSLLMVASASIPFALSRGMPELQFFRNQLLYMTIGFVAATIPYYFLSLKRLYKTETQFILLGITGVLLVAVLFSTPINGAKRWLQLGGFNFQVAELVKLVMIVFVSDFVVRRSFEVRNGMDGFLRILLVVVLLTVLLLSQPDFGSLVVILGTIFAIFYIAGAPYKHFIALGAAAIGGLVLMVTTAQYRVVRVMSFVNPFDDVQDTDYQLARSLIAFGRGQFTGVGYGESVQKLSHLPEAHTDFLLAITGEELGFVGVAMVLILEALIIASAMRISYNALKRRQMRMSYTAFGIGVVFIGQTIINAAMNMGAIPTKGLTMPFFSYGGSSMLVSLLMVALLLKIYKESAQIEKSQCRYY
ncbi:MAG: FtsW/RodA/SpoVE family cell cycle protein [Psychrobacter sp.]|uniref:FtsW/RodA/SpoVE family cell cycle protein n=1 Tax=Psychrobacter sp. TaxID=56811 RepID=UPI003F9746A6